jgi:hypothetical protein
VNERVSMCVCLFVKLETSTYDNHLLYKSWSLSQEAQAVSMWVLVQVLVVAVYQSEE